MASAPTSDPTCDTPSRPRAWLLAAILLALVLRFGGSWGKKLWLDELHSAAICQRPLAEWLGPGDLGGYTPFYFLLSLPVSRAGSDLAAPELFPIISVPGRYRELMVRVGQASGIEIAALPPDTSSRRLEIARTPPERTHLLARSPAGIGLYALD